MDSNKICFIMCVNDERELEEAIYYINRLKVPDGYTVDCLTISEAASMASGYNEAMISCDAKYKIYMHQDVMIVNPDFLLKLLELFQNSHIGMIGMVGAPVMPVNKIIWNCNRVGKLYSGYVYKTDEIVMGNIIGDYAEVEAVDGFLMATQYDISWREDIFDGWDFYDISQSYEFRKAGYKVIVPNMEHAWCLHDDDLMNLRNYYIYRKKFKEEYDKD